MSFLDSWPQMAGTGEAILFWCVAIFMILAALGVLFFKKAAYSAISMVAVMLGLAIIYVTLEAPFLGVVQVVVYTGAIMMLFLFVIMMIGIGASDDYRRQRRGYIVAAVCGGVALALIIGAIIIHSTVTTKGDYQVDPRSNEPISALALKLFSEHWFSMVLAGALLITAAIGAILLTHADALAPKLTQRRMAEAKLRAFKEMGRHIGQLPSPGVYATTNASNVPAFSGDTLEPVVESVPRVFRVRGVDRPLENVEPEVAQSLSLARKGERDDSPFAAIHAKVPQAGGWGMPGAPAPTGLTQPHPPTAEGASPTGEKALPAGDVASKDTPTAKKEGDAK